MQKQEQAQQQQQNHHQQQQHKHQQHQQLPGKSSDVVSQPKAFKGKSKSTIPNSNLVMEMPLLSTVVSQGNRIGEPTFCLKSIFELILKYINECVSISIKT